MSWLSSSTLQAATLRSTPFWQGPTVAGQVEPLLSQLRRSLSTKDQWNLHDLEQRLHVTEVGQKLYRQQPERMRDLQAMVDGLLWQKPIGLSYPSPRRQVQGTGSRVMRVQAICFVIHRGGVYFVVDVLKGHVEESGGRRTLLALDRLGEVSADHEAMPCAYPSDFHPREFFQSAFGIWRGDEAHDVRLRVDPAYASAVRERAWHPTQQLEEQPDGSVVLTMQLGALDEVTDWVLGMGSMCASRRQMSSSSASSCGWSARALARYPRAR